MPDGNFGISIFGLRETRTLDEDPSENISSLFAEKATAEASVSSIRQEETAGILLGGASYDLCVTQSCFSGIELEEPVVFSC